MTIKSLEGIIIPLGMLSNEGTRVGEYTERARVLRSFRAIHISV